MIGIHMVIGVGEAVITMVVLSAVARVRPGLLVEREEHTSSLASVSGYSLVLLTAVVLFLSPFASIWPDGLETVAMTLGFDSHAVQHPMIPSWLAGYRIPWIESPIVSMLAAGAIGVAVVLLIAWAYLSFAHHREESQTKKTSNAT